MTYVFGPVPSRRLGLSLGVDLIPAKTCTYDCLYCQVGRTTQKTIQTDAFVPVQEVIDELKKRLEILTPDAVTLSGSGEPTLHAKIDQVITAIKGITDAKVAILTNGSLLGQGVVRRRVTGADIILPTLTTAFEGTFKMIHRPHPELHLKSIIEGLKRLRPMYKGQIFLEVFLLAQINDSQEELEGLKKVIDEISPDKIQLNTVVRPPADQSAMSLDMERLKEIRDFFGQKAEIIAETPLRRTWGQYDAVVDGILEMAKRRPLRASDIAILFNMPLQEAEGVVKGLEMKGTLRQQEHLGEIYYMLG
ncbi:MAG: radical SAM protein [Desulfobacteraceae bacterium]|jgi:wyosine [tRNA(Phe)-imidazoG37] synthetase (radical SAM superfamily)